MDDITSQIIDLQDAIANVHWDTLTEFNGRITTLHDSLSNIRDLIGDDNWFDDTGSWTEDGVAVLGTYIQDLETYKNEIEGINTELTNLALPYEGNEDYYANLGIHSEQELYDKLQELKDMQASYLQGIKDSEDEIVAMYEAQIDAVEEYHNQLVESYSDYINYVKEALDAERELYNFKQNINKQNKTIAATERKIASLSGSTDQADIAERRKLQAQLLEQRESLDDEYRSNAKDAQIKALEEEQEAYEEATNRYIQTLRDTLKRATKDTEVFVSGIASLVLSNADIVLAKYKETGLALDEALTTPWQSALDAMEEFGGPAGLGVMDEWTSTGGFFDTFMQTASSQLTSPWVAGMQAMDAFNTSVGNVMQSVLIAIQSNIAAASASISSFYSQIVDTAARAQRDISNISPAITPTQSTTPTTTVRGKLILPEGTILLGSGQSKSEVMATILDLFIKRRMAQGDSYSDANRSWNNAGYGNQIQYYAKGTTGTKKMDGLSLMNRNMVMS